MDAIPRIERTGPVDKVVSRPKDLSREEVAPICRRMIRRPEIEFKAPTYAPLSEADLILVSSEVLIKYVIALMEDPSRMDAELSDRNFVQAMS